MSVNIDSIYKTNGLMDMIPFEVILSVISPILGGLISVIKKPRISIIYHLLAFAAGIMLAISFFDLIPESISYCTYRITIYGIIIGFFIMYLLHLLLPNNKSLKETASFLALGMAVHNFAEGMVIAIATNLSNTLNMIVFTSIFIHNFAEGLCTASPIYYATKNKLKAFIITSFTALPLLIGYLITQLVFHTISQPTLGFLLALVAGLMLNITLSELIPQSANKTTGYATEFSLIIGIILVIILTYI